MFTVCTVRDKINKSFGNKFSQRSPKKKRGFRRLVITTRTGREDDC
ncbi:unnamed protein product [Staurois parvus]|uniref:Uncharacterized protein n=1 Tax=Staurois parvus TaxID=386267 RepID=A0ABN9FD67_9NEOB|nr:unnamed protein product [Staurois parvus]